MDSLLMVAAMAIFGLVTGIYVTGLIHDHRVRDLGAGQYVAMHQMRDKSFRQAMPPIGLANFALVTLSALLAVEAGAAKILALGAAALLFADIVLTIRLQLPLNRTIQSWTDGAIPQDWSAVRDRWGHHHTIRTLLAVIAYSLYAAAIVLTVSTSPVNATPAAQALERGLGCQADNAMRRVELIFGLGRSDGGSVSDAEWRLFLEREVTPRFPDGLTVLSADGQWRNASGDIIKEPSRMLIIWLRPAEAGERNIEAIRASFRARFKQESVMRADGRSCVSF